ncbi:MAG: hypothetical protein HZB99_03705 [Candidatus Harrisonbacteria bacterium]|nr:hypothetical protein [Candidatus Harrisonbacteria bacterium]
MKFNFERPDPSLNEPKKSADTRRGRDFSELQKKMLKETEEGVNKLIEEDPKLKGEHKEQFIKKAGEKAHYSFLENNNPKDERGRFVPRFRPVKNPEWLTPEHELKYKDQIRRETDPKTGQENAMIDIANIPYEDLPPKWQAANNASVEVALLAYESGQFDTDQVGNMIHERWKKDNLEYKNEADLLVYLDPNKFASPEEFQAYIVPGKLKENFANDHLSYYKLNEKTQKMDHNFIEAIKKDYQGAISG